VWHWPSYQLWPATVVFLVVDLSFLLGTMTNIFKGGWVPILFAAVVMLVMLGWNNGYRALNAYMESQVTHWSAIREELAHGSTVRVPGVGIYLASSAEDVPSDLKSQLKVLHAMPADVVVATVVTDSVPYAQREPVVEVLLPRVTRVTIPVGYMQTADIPAAIRSSLLGEVEGVATYYLSERKFVGTDAGQVPEYRERFFGFLHKNSQTPAAYFGLPAERVIAIGTRVDL
jgi:KUP system potassium uptake protein